MRITRPKDYPRSLFWSQVSGDDCTTQAEDDCCWLADKVVSQKKEISALEAALADVWSVCSKTVDEWGFTIAPLDKDTVEKLRALLPAAPEPPGQGGGRG